MRKVKQERVEEIWKAVEREPGIRAGKVARDLGVPRVAVSRALPALEERGLLLSEDRQGGLWPWRK